MENDAATRADLKALENRIDGKLDALENRIDGKLDTLEQRILDNMQGMIRDSETRLLQAFNGYAEATNKRFNQIEGNVGISLNRLGTLENRILEVEKRLNIPPAA